MTGYSVKYLFYEETGKSTITIPRAIIEANKLDWKHKEEVNIVVEEINGKKGIFLFKKEV